MERRGFLKNLAPLALISSMSPLAAIKHAFGKVTTAIVPKKVVPVRDFALQIAGRILFLESRGVNLDEVVFDGDNIRVASGNEPAESDPLVEVFSDTEVDKFKCNLIAFEPCDRIAFGNEKLLNVPSINEDLKRLRAGFDTGPAR